MGGGLHRLSFSSPPPLARWCRSPYLMFARPFATLGNSPTLWCAAMISVKRHAPR